jgi:hypothetical protein
MPQTPSSQEEKVQESGAKPPYDRWLSVRAEQYVEGHAGRKLAELSPEEVDAYLADLGRKPGVGDRQIRQAVDGIRMLLGLAGRTWSMKWTGPIGRRRHGI